MKFEVHCWNCGSEMMIAEKFYNKGLIIELHVEPCKECAAQQMRAADTSPLCAECEIELHLTTGGEHVCRNEACGLYR